MMMTVVPMMKEAGVRFTDLCVGDFDSCMTHVR